MAKIVLFQNQTSNGFSNEVYTGGGEFRLNVSGDLGGGTLAVELSDDGTNWIPMHQNGVAYTMTAARSYRMKFIPQPLKFRLELTGATAPDVNVTLTN